MINKEKINLYLKLIRWHKPIGSLLLLWPVLTALWLASGGHPHASTLVIFIVGVFLMRSAGCIINDLADRKWDNKIARTKDRPITTGKISVLSAVIFFIILCIAAFLLVLQLNQFTVYLSVIAMLLAVIYPFLKRVTNLPQVGLGLAFQWGCIMAYAAELNYIPAIAWLVFVANLLFTVAYDSQYAMIDRADDLKVGIKSTAILFGKYDRWIIFLLQLVGLALMFLVGMLYHLNSWYNIGLVLAFCFSLYQFSLVWHRKEATCFQAFLNNHYLLLMIFVGVFLSYLR